MKKENLLKSSLTKIIILVAIVTSLSACEKSEAPKVSSLKLEGTQWVSLEDSHGIKTILNFYNDNKCTKTITYHKGSDLKTEYSYTQEGKIVTSFNAPNFNTMRVRIEADYLVDISNGKKLYKKVSLND